MLWKQVANTGASCPRVLCAAGGGNKTGKEDRKCWGQVYAHGVSGSALAGGSGMESEASLSLHTLRITHTGGESQERNRDPHWVSIIMVVSPALGRHR